MIYPVKVKREPPSAVEPLPGSVVLQFVRCGKPGCSCNYGQRHGPYFYRVWREGGKVCKAYVKITDLEKVREQTQLYEVLADELKRLKQLHLDASKRLVQQRRVRRKLVQSWSEAGTNR